MKQTNKNKISKTMLKSFLEDEELNKIRKRLLISKILKKMILPTDVQMKMIYTNINEYGNKI